jgi:hypothetical protein
MNDNFRFQELLRRHVSTPKIYPIDEQERKRIATHTVVRSDKVVSVSVPENSTQFEEVASEPESEARESIYAVSGVCHRSFPFYPGGGPSVVRLEFFPGRPWDPAAKRGVFEPASPDGVSGRSTEIVVPLRGPCVLERTRMVPP